MTRTPDDTPASRPSAATMDPAREHTVPLHDVLAYGAGALPAERASAVAAHLEGCAYCRARLREIPALDEALALEDDPEAPPGQAEALALIGRRLRRRLRTDRLWVLAVAAPLKLVLLRRAVNPTERRCVRASAGLAALVLTVAVLRRALERKA